MRAVVQRVARATVYISETKKSAIEKGLLIFLGVEKGDSETDADYLLGKVLNLRVFEDPEGKMNLSLVDQGGGLMVISQFTLLGDCRKGRRPSFFPAEEPNAATRLYDHVIRQAEAAGVPVASGKFQAMMTIEAVNDGPVTILLDSRRVF
jgi:D-tyrosyl-tRNA(Tyr) deacylase